jgi:formiminotetrahydrofolate cyclodeaminase
MSEVERAAVRESVAKICELHGVPEYAYWNIADECAQLFEAICKEVIGKSENHIMIDTGVSADMCDCLKDSSLSCNCPAVERNDLRAQQRQTLAKLLGQQPAGDGK